MGSECQRCGDKTQERSHFRFRQGRAIGEGGGREEEGYRKPDRRHDANDQQVTLAQPLRQLRSGKT